VKQKAYKNNPHVLKALQQYQQNCKNPGRKIFIFIGKVVPVLS
jgi:hypothetical protein